MASAPSPEPTTPAAEPAAAASAPAAPEAPAAENNADIEEIMNVFSLRDEPLPNFGSASETPEPPATVVTTPAEPAAPAAPAAAAPPAAAPALPGIQEPAAPAAAVPAAPDALKLASLEATVQALQAQLAQRAAPAAPAAEVPAAPLVKPEEVNYGLTIPNEVLTAVFSEDQAQAAAGMTHLVNSLANIVHRNVLTAARRDLHSMRTEIQNESSYSVQEQARRDAQQQYYTAFPTHDNPNIKILVAAEAQKLGAEHPNLQWGPDFMNALGARVNNVLTSLGANPAVAPQSPAPAASAQGLSPTAPVQPPPKPASFMPQAPSGGIPAFEAGQDLIADTFSFGS